METENFESRLAALKQRQLEILKVPADLDALSVLLRHVKIDLHQLYCDMARSDLQETGCISGATRRLLEKNRIELCRRGAEAIAVEMEAAVLRKCGPEEEPLR